MNIKTYLRDKIPLGDPFPVASGQCVAKLDQNESPCDLPESLKNEIVEELRSYPWNRYPQPSEYRTAKIAFAEALEIDPDNVAMTVGCDEAIQGVHYLAGGLDRRALVFHPTYPMLSHAALMAGTTMNDQVISPEYCIDPQIFPNHHLILIANPNNPTGNLTAPETIEAALLHKSLVFIDEAYFDLSGVTVKDWIPRFPNLVIGRSCSKSLLAGIRLGALIGHPLLIRAFESLVTAPYNLTHLQMITARRYADILPVVRQVSQEIRDERVRISAAMEKMGFHVYPSETNFILFKVIDGEHIFRFLLKAGVRIRDMSAVRGLTDHLRVTVGKQAHNSLFLEVLRDAMSGQGQ